MSSFLKAQTSQTSQQRKDKFKLNAIRTKKLKLQWKLLKFRRFLVTNIKHVLQNIREFKGN